MMPSCFCDILQMAGRPLESELQTWKMHAQMFVRLASKTINESAAQQSRLKEHADTAQASLIR